MKKYIFPILFLGVLAVVFFSVKNVTEHLESHYTHVFSTPYNLNMLVISFSLPENNFYLSDNEIPIEQEKPNNDWLYAIGPIIASIAICSFVFLFFALNLRGSSVGGSFLFFNFVLILYYFSLLDYLTYYDFVGAFYFLGFFITVPLTFFLRNLFFKRPSWEIIFYATPIFLGITYAFYPENAFQERYLLRLISYTQFICILYCIILFGRKLRDHMKKRSGKTILQRLPQGIEAIKYILAATLIGNFASSIFLYFLISFADIEMNVAYNVILFLPAFTSIVYFLLGVRFGFVYTNVIVSEVLVRGVFISFFLFLYLFSIGYYLLGMPNREESLWIHLSISVIFLLILDPFRTLIAFLLDQSLIARNIILSQYLMETSMYLSNPKSIDTSLKKIGECLENGLDIQWMKIYLVKNLFISSNPSIEWIEDKNPIWEVIRKKQRLRHTPIFTRFSASKAADFLNREEALLMICFHKFKGFALISEKKDQRVFLSADIKFLRSVIKHGELLLENYFFLQETNKLKRKESELIYAKTIQKRVLNPDFSDKKIQVSSVIKPYLKVTGDYIDFFKKAPNSYTLFLGDASGHGLGSAYLMNLIRSIIRSSQAINRENLQKTFQKINQYLTFDYPGSEFLTLVGINIKIKNKKSTLLEFINAGQHSALIYLKKSKRLKKFAFSQKALGIVKTDYKISNLEVSEPFKIFIYSDGLFEIFGVKGKMLGEKNVRRWIKQSSELDIKSQKEYILKRLNNKQNISQVIDDISLVTVDIKE